MEPITEKTENGTTQGQETQRLIKVGYRDSDSFESTEQPFYMNPNE